MSRLIELLKRARGDASIRHTERVLGERIRQLSLQVADLQAAVDRNTAASEDVKDRVISMGPTSRKAASRSTHRAPVSLSTDSESWKTLAQEGELEFHKKPNVRSGDQWEVDTDRKWTNFGFDRDGWADKLIVDVGAGSRLRTKWFRDARIAAIEPLGERFVEEVEWQDLDQADELYPVPAEQLIPELVGRADLVVSINALDHGYDFAGAATSIRKYLKDDGLAFLSFDQHEVPDEMHPLVLNEEITREVFEGAGFEITHFEEAGRYHGGPGLLALNYWLRPAPATT